MVLTGSVVWDSELLSDYVSDRSVDNWTYWKTYLLVMTVKMTVYWKTYLFVMTVRITELSGIFSRTFEEYSDLAKDKDPWNTPPLKIWNLVFLLKL